MLLLFAAAVAILVLFSQRPLLSESSRNPRPPFSLENGAAPDSSTAVQTVEPVVFALIMYSEGSAREGAILLKVL